MYLYVYLKTYICILFSGILYTIPLRAAALAIPLGYVKITDLHISFWLSVGKRMFWGKSLRSKLYRFDTLFNKLQ